MSQKCCGTCMHSSVYDMNQGEVTELRCNHPALAQVRQSMIIPDWLIDKNSFEYSDNPDCSGWEKEVTTLDRVRALEDKIREQVPELGVLSSMDIHFLENAFDYLTKKKEEPS